MKGNVITGEYYIKNHKECTKQEEENLIEYINWWFKKRKEMKNKWEQNKKPKYEYDTKTNKLEPNLALTNLYLEKLYKECLIIWEKKK